MKAPASSATSKSSRKNGAQKSPTDAAWTGSTHLAHEDYATPPVRLTPREREVLALLCEGLPNKLIGRRLKISSGTVKVHISNIFRVLNVSNRLRAVVLARRWALMQEPDQTEHATPTRTEFIQED